jgi:anion-transporting  ArsA/GET3 family ATPase
LSSPTLGGDVSPAARSILDRPLVIVTGKGGTGKTTVVAALGLTAARQGRRVMLVETGRDEHLPRLFAPQAPPVGYGGRELCPRLHAMRVEPYEALTEYLKLQLGVPALVSRALRNRGFRQLLDAAPGWRELVTLGKVWHLGRATEADGRARFDLVVVDAPATGHGLTFLDVPRVVVSAVRAGPLRRHASWVEEMVRDPERTLLLPVALAEELPARETTELVERVRKELGIAVDRVVVNAMQEQPYPEGVADLDARLRRLTLPELPGLPRPHVLASCAAHLRSRFELHREYADKIAAWTQLPIVRLPLLPGGVRGADDLALLAEALLVQPAGSQA